MNKYINNNKGVAALPLVLVFGTLIVVLGLSLSTMSVSTAISIESEHNSAKALHFAEAGIHDAQLRLARDYNFTCTDEDCYTIPFLEDGCVNENACVWVTVSAGAGTVSDPRTITARGRSGINIRTLQSEITFDPETLGKLATTTWKEI